MLSGFPVGLGLILIFVSSVIASVRNRTDVRSVPFCVSFDQ